jgi:hypothetical protein
MNWVKVVLYFLANTRPLIEASPPLPSSLVQEVKETKQISRKAIPVRKLVFMKVECGNQVEVRGAAIGWR